MKLIELNPRWTVMSFGDTHSGISFDCPHCRSIRICVSFVGEGNNIWKMTGNTFEDITLSPSIDTSSSGHWHGFIQNGEII